MEKAKKTPKLTQKQAKFIKGIAEGKTQVQSALDSYDTDSYEVANAIAVENLQKPSIQQALDIAFGKHKITIDRAIEPINKALNAKKIVPIEGDFFVTDVDDLDMQLKGSDRALKLMGVGQGKEPPGTANFIQIINEKGSKYNV